MELLLPEIYIGDGKLVEGDLLPKIILPQIVFQLILGEVDAVIG